MNAAVIGWWGSEMRGFRRTNRESYKIKLMNVTTSTCIRRVLDVFKCDFQHSNYSNNVANATFMNNLMIFSLLKYRLPEIY